MRNYLYKGYSARIYMLFEFYRTAIIVKQQLQTCRYFEERFSANFQCKEIKQASQPTFLVETSFIYHIKNNRDRRHRLSLFLFICCLSTSNLSTCRLVNSSTNILLLWNNLEHFRLANQLHTSYFLYHINCEERLIRSELSL